jgi:hypothetical protein
VILHGDGPQPGDASHSRGGAAPSKITLTWGLHTSAVVLLLRLSFNALLLQCHMLNICRARILLDAAAVAV